MDRLEFVELVPALASVCVRRHQRTFRFRDPTMAFVTPSNWRDWTACGVGLVRISRIVSAMMRDTPPLGLAGTGSNRRSSIMGERWVILRRFT